MGEGGDSVLGRGLGMGKGGNSVIVSSPTTRLRKHAWGWVLRMG